MAVNAGLLCLFCALLATFAFLEAGTQAALGQASWSWVVSPGPSPVVWATGATVLGWGSALAALVSGFVCMWTVGSTAPKE